MGVSIEEHQAKLNRKCKYCKKPATFGQPYPLCDVHWARLESGFYGKGKDRNSAYRRIREGQKEDIRLRRIPED